MHTCNQPNAAGDLLTGSELPLHLAADCGVSNLPSFKAGPFAIGYPFSRSRSVDHLTVAIDFKHPYVMVPAPIELRQQVGRGACLPRLVGVEP